jgi:hypothetical protein
VLGGATKQPAQNTTRLGVGQTRFKAVAPLEVTCERRSFAGFLRSTAVPQRQAVSHNTRASLLQTQSARCFRPSHPPCIVCHAALALGRRLWQHGCARAVCRSFSPPPRSFVLFNLTLRRTAPS